MPRTHPKKRVVHFAPLNLLPAVHFPEGDRKRLLCLLAMAALSRVLFAGIAAATSGTLSFYREDTATYILPAQSLLHGFFMSSGVNSLPGTPELYRTPGYPLFLLPAVALHHEVIIGLLENFLLVLASAMLVWKITDRLAPGTKAAFWAALLYCFEPLSFVSSETLLSETLFVTVLLLSVWLLVEFLYRPSFSKLAMAAFVLGCTVYIRPVSLYLGVWLAPIFLFFPGTEHPRRRVLRALVFPSIFVLTLAPWIVRNEVAAGYGKFSSSQDYNLYFMAAGPVEAKLHPRIMSSSELQVVVNHTPLDLYFMEHPEQRAWPEARIADTWGREGKKIILAHLATYAVLHAKGCLKVLFNPGVTEALFSFNAWPRRSLTLTAESNRGTVYGILWMFRQSPAAIVLLPLMMLSTLLYYALGLAGLPHLKFESRALLCSLVFYFVLISGIPIMEARYRVPFLPFVCIAAGVAIERWLSRRQATKNTALMASVASN